MNKDKLTKEFNLKKFGQRGWLRGDLFCPECNTNDKFAVLFTENGAVCHCFKCSIKFPLFKLLLDLGRRDLLDSNDEYTPKSKLSDLITTEDKLESEVILPLGFKSITYDKYLDDRSFTKQQYYQFNVGVADLDPKTRNKLVFLIYQKNKLSGWLARSKNSKEWHKQNVVDYKLGKCELVLRYRNSNNDFSKMLGGLDEIENETDTLILVEGLFDKANVDRLLDLNFNDNVKCCYTFGDDISVDQIKLIPSSIKKIILMYDGNALKNMKISGGRLINNFDVDVALIENEDIDPGNMDIKYLMTTLNNTVSFINFYKNLIGTING